MLCDKKFDPDVWSCRKGKGLHACLERTQKLLVKYSGAYVWRMDIRKFFDSTLHEVLKRGINRVTKDQKPVWLCDEVVDSYYCGQIGVGIPIGNLTSQVLANIYLNEFDRFVRHELGALAYVRYGDDMAVFCRMRQEAFATRERATRFLFEQLGLRINPKNDVVVRTRDGLHFLGHVITGNYVVVDKNTTKRALARIQWRSAASYKAMKLAKYEKKRLDWLLLDEIERLEELGY